MNKKSKAIQARNAVIQARFATLRHDKPNRSMLSIYAQLAVEQDLSVERIKKIVNNYRL